MRWLHDYGALVPLAFRHQDPRQPRHGRSRRPRHDRASEDGSPRASRPTHILRRRFPWRPRFGRRARANAHRLRRWAHERARCSRLGPRHGRPRTVEFVTQPRDAERDRKRPNRTRLLRARCDSSRQGGTQTQVRGRDRPDLEGPSACDGHSGAASQRSSRHDRTCGLDHVHCRHSGRRFRAHYDARNRRHRATDAARPWPELAPRNPARRLHSYADGGAGTVHRYHARDTRMFSMVASRLRSCPEWPRSPPVLRT